MNADGTAQHTLLPSGTWDKLSIVYNGVEASGSFLGNKHLEGSSIMKLKWVAIVAVIVIVVAAGVGYGAYTYGKTAGETQALATRNAFLAARLAGGGGTAADGGFAGAAGGTGRGNFDPNNFANGQVKSVNGDTIQLSTATDVVTVEKVTAKPKSPRRSPGPSATSSRVSG